MILDSVLILLVIVVLVSAIFHAVRLPPILGYITVGMLVGPHALSWIPDTQITWDLAELGVIFLLFTIGLEFSLTRMIAMRHKVFAYGGLQVGLTLLLTATAGYWFGMSLAKATMLGAVVAMSSTAIVSKQLTEQLAINTPSGMNAIGILLFQDLAFIPLLILIPSLVGSPGDLHISLLKALLKGLIAITAILMAGRWLLKPIFYRIANTRSLELFTLTVLSITLGAAWLTHQLGVSLALGSFLAGMMLGETEFRHQIEVDIRPFRDVLLGLFFVAIGMQFDIRVFQESWLNLIFLFLALVGFKALLIYGICRLFCNNGTALQTGLILAHGGEFSFLLLSLGLKYNIFSTQYSQVILAALLMSMLLAPLLIRYSGVIAAKLLSKEPDFTPKDTIQQLDTAVGTLRKHVIICGYGRVGQNVGKLLTRFDIPFIALDLDVRLVQSARLAGEHVCYANATNPEILEHLGLHQAQCLLISFQNQRSAINIAEQVRRLNRRIPIIVRTRDDMEAHSLYKAGVTEIVPETLETSLILATHLLLLLKIPIQQVSKLMQDIRRDHYDLLHQIFPGQDEHSTEEVDNQHAILYPVTLLEGAYAIGRDLSELNLNGDKVSVTAVRRQQDSIVQPPSNFKIEANDVLILYGTLSDLECAERQLLEG